MALIGSVATGRAIARAAADRLKHVTLELGGKNACIIYPDADVDKAIAGAVAGMNFTWCGQSCGSTSRVFVHASLHDRVVAGIVAAVRRFKPGLPTDAVDDDGRDHFAGAVSTRSSVTSRSAASRARRSRAAARARAIRISPTATSCRRPCSPASRRTMRIAQRGDFRPGAVRPVVDGRGADARRRQRRRIRLELLDLHA